MTAEAIIGVPENIRVLFIDLSKRFGGASMRALTLARHLAPWQATIAGIKDSPVVKAAQEANIPVRIVGGTRIDPMIPSHLMNIIHQEGFQIIDTQNIQSKFWASIAAWSSDAAFVSTLNSAYREEHAGSWKGRVYSGIDHLTNSRVDRYVAVSQSIVDSLLQSGISSEMIDLVTNAVEVARPISGDSRRKIRKDLGVSEDGLLFTSVGRLVWAKGYEDLIDAFSRIAEQLPNTTSVILGDGILHEELTNQIRRHNLSKRIRLLGHYNHDAVIEILQASDLFIMPSKSEGVPFALLEAASLGLPILATCCGGIPEVLTDGIEAHLVPVGDISALAEGMVRLSNDRSIRTQIGKNARIRIENNFGIHSQIEGTKNAYRKAILHKHSHGLTEKSVVINKAS
jgi:glycosyltransferase involved in cell wall biosynthesis